MLPPDPEIGWTDSKNGKTQLFNSWGVVKNLEMSAPLNEKTAKDKQALKMTFVSRCWKNKWLWWLSKPLLWWRLNGFSHFYRKQNVQLWWNNKRWHLSVGKQYVSLHPLWLSASIHGCFDRRFTDVLNCVRRLDRESNLAINIIPVKMEKQSSWRAQSYFLPEEQNVKDAHVANGFPTN